MGSIGWWLMVKMDKSNIFQWCIYTCVCPGSLCIPFIFFVCKRDRSQRSVTWHYPACYQVEKARTERARSDGAGEQGKRGEWRAEERLRKMRGKGTDDWKDIKKKDRGQWAWTNGWEREVRQTEWHLNVCWEQTRDAMTGVTSMKTCYCFFGDTQCKRSTLAEHNRTHILYTDNVASHCITSPRHNNLMSS